MSSLGPIASRKRALPSDDENKADKDAEVALKKQKEDEAEELRKRKGRREKDLSNAQYKYGGTIFGNDVLEIEGFYSPALSVPAWSFFNKDPCYKTSVLVILPSEYPHTTPELYFKDKQIKSSLIFRSKYVGYPLHEIPDGYPLPALNGDSWSPAMTLCDYLESARWAIFAKGRA